MTNYGRTTVDTAYAIATISTPTVLAFILLVFTSLLHFLLAMAEDFELEQQQEYINIAVAKNKDAFLRARSFGDIPLDCMYMSHVFSGFECHSIKLWVIGEVTASMKDVIDAATHARGDVYYIESR